MSGAQDIFNGVPSLSRAERLDPEQEGILVMLMLLSSCVFKKESLNKEEVTWSQWLAWEPSWVPGMLYKPRPLGLPFHTKNHPHGAEVIWTLLRLTTSKQKQDRLGNDPQEHSLHGNAFSALVIARDAWGGGKLTGRRPCGGLWIRNLPLWHVHCSHPHLRAWATCAPNPPFLTQPLHHCVVQ